ncbi:MAG: ATP-binding protein [Chloroflexota bacterium]
MQRKRWIGQNTLAIASQYLVMCAVVLGTTLAIFHFRSSLGTLNISVLYLFIVLICAMIANPGVTLFCGLFSFLCYDFFLVPPVFTLQVAVPSLLLDPVAFLVVSVVTCIMAERARQRAIQTVIYREADLLRSTLLSLISHNLRTPLAIIKTALTSVLAIDESETESRLLLLDANEECDRLNRLIANVLQLSRLEAHAVQINRDWHSLDEVISVVFKRWPEAVADKSLTAIIPDVLPLFQFDFDLIDAVLTNLVENALRHGEPPCKLTVALQPAEKAEIWIRVEDTGSGVKLADRGRLFQRFATTKASGIGLGLAVCKGLVEAHGGRLWAEFEPYQTRFIVALPFVSYFEDETDGASADR